MNNHQEEIYRARETAQQSRMYLALAENSRTSPSFPHHFLYPTSTKSESLFLCLWVLGLKWTGPSHKHTETYKIKNNKRKFTSLINLIKDLATCPGRKCLRRVLLHLAKSVMNKHILSKGKKFITWRLAVNVVAVYNIWLVVWIS